MASVAAQLKDLRQQLEKLQVEVAGRQSISAMVVWDGQNKSSVAQNVALPKGGMALGAHGGSGVLDPSTLPKPTMPPWDGWKNIDRAVK